MPLNLLPEALNSAAMLHCMSQPNKVSKLRSASAWKCTTSDCHANGELTAGAIKPVL